MVSMMSAATPLSIKALRNPVMACKEEKWSKQLNVHHTALPR